MSNLALQIWPEILRTLNAGSISGTYMGIGSALLYPSRIYWLQNNTDDIITFSWDGVNDHFALPSNAFLLLDVESNKTAVGGSNSVPAGTRTYAKGSPTAGTIYLSVFYGRNG